MALKFIDYGSLISPITVTTEFICTYPDEGNASPWTKEEDKLILHNYKKVGRKWKQVSFQLIGRGTNDVRNRFNNYIMKKLCHK